MKKSISISIRVSEEELEKFKQATRLEAYASYSEFVRRTALIETPKMVKVATNDWKCGASKFGLRNYWRKVI